MKRIRHYRRFFLLALAMASTPPLADGGIDIVQPYQPPTSTPSPEKFEVCYQYTCKEIAELTITQAQWQQILDLFLPVPADAVEERERIAAAVSRMEILVGKKIDTSDDRGGNLQGFSADGYQMDCVDESTNTTTYLRMMERSGLLKWHRVEDRVTRNLFSLLRWPHTTAVISEKKSGKRWVVDSWFYDNGVPPVILPLEKWRDDWTPEGFKG
jgi:hypothetical protein